MADDTYSIASGADLYAGYPLPPDPEAPAPDWDGFLIAPTTATGTGGNGISGFWAWYSGQWLIAGESFYDDHGIDMFWKYSRTNPAPERMRPYVRYHGSAANSGAGMTNPFSPDATAARNSLEVQHPDAEAYDGAWREWHAFDESGNRHQSRRVAASLELLQLRYGDALDFDGLGIVTTGGSMGGGGAVFAVMLLPSPWREKIAFVSASIGGVLPRLKPGKYAGDWPADSGGGAAHWDALDFEIQAASDPVVRGCHFRHRFSSNDNNFAEAGENTQMPMVNICEANKIAAAMSWVANGHSAGEPGVLPMTRTYPWESDTNCDVTLDRAHPCFTNSTGNHPLTASDRLDTATYPRGHYNLGLSWHHANIVDSSTEIIFPIKYARLTGIGGGIPDQPSSITVDVTPRRAKNFTLANGETINWTFDGGAQTGSATVSGDVVTAVGIALTSGNDYKNLRFYRA